MEEFKNFVTQKLKIEIPRAYQDQKSFEKFVYRRIKKIKVHFIDIEE